MKLEKVNIDILHTILYAYHQNGVKYVDMELLDGNILNIWPSDLENPQPEIKIEDIS